MNVLVDFFTDSAKIIFGSAVVGYFIPSISGNVSAPMLASGIAATGMFLGLASLLSKHSNKNNK